jgi:hypothetical protein
LAFFVPAFSQESDGYGVHLPKFYKQKIHFGFTIAGNQSDFRLNPKPNSLFPDTIITDSRYKVKTVYSIPIKGFAIGLVSDVRLFEYVRLRFTPSISFGTRKIEYTLATSDRDSFNFSPGNKNSIKTTWKFFGLRYWRWWLFSRFICTKESGRERWWRQSIG